MGFPGGRVVKNPPANAEDTGSLGQEDSLEQEMATHSSILAWNSMNEGAGGLQSTGPQRSDLTEYTHLHKD